MASKTIDDLKVRRDDLIARQRKVAFRLRSAAHTNAVQELATLQAAIAALDAVIAEVGEAPEFDPKAMISPG